VAPFVPYLALTRPDFALKKAFDFVYRHVSLWKELFAFSMPPHLEKSEAPF
jgi:hypothetical protein